MYITNKFFLSIVPNSCEIKLSTISEDVAMMMIKNMEVKSIIKDEAMCKIIEEKSGKVLEPAVIPKKYSKGDTVMFISTGRKREDNIPNRWEYKILNIV